MSAELPQGWATTPLSQVAELNPRHPKGLDDSMPISFARMAVLSETKPEFDSLEERKLGEVRKGFTHFAEGDVLFAKITPCTIPVPVPPLAEQQEIGRRVAGLFALADQIEARFQKAREQVDKLTPSLLARAFRGHLVRQDLTDEPAEKLLERIKTHHESQSYRDARK